MSAPKRQNILSRKLLVLVLSISALTASIATLLQLGLEYRDGRENVAASLESLEKTGIESLRHLLWTLDAAAIEKQAASALLVREVLSIEVLDEKGVSIHSSKKPEWLSYSSRLERVFELKSEPGEHLGQVKILYTLDLLHDHLLRRLVLILGSNILKTLLSSILLVAVFQSLIVRRILLIGQHLQQAKTKGVAYISPLKWQSARIHDEIDDLAKEVQVNLEYIRGEQLAIARRLALQNEELEIERDANALTNQELDATLKKLSAEEEHAKNTARLAELGTLASTIAHEIKNPLAIITGRLEQLIATPETTASNKAVQSLESMHKAAERIVRIIKSLTTFARDGSQEEFQKISTKELASDVQDLVAHTAKQHRVAVACEMPQIDLQLYGRPTQLAQVLVNLTNNAIQAVATLPAEQRWVRLSFATSTEASGTVIIRVRDGGLGIPPEVASKLFTPYFTTKARGEGTGLGLSVVKDIVIAHGGDIKLNSEAENTEFVVSLKTAA